MKFTSESFEHKICVVYLFQGGVSNENRYLRALKLDDFIQAKAKVQ
jgi:hypothetical protein